MARNPPWEYDELLVVLDLYLTEHRVLNRNDSRVLVASETLRALPLHHGRNDVGFRTPDAVVMKLANFRAIDPNAAGVGLRAGGRRDLEVWRRFAHRPGELSPLVARLGTLHERRDVAVPEVGEQQVLEGRLLFRVHRRRERDHRLVARKRDNHLRRHGVLHCEVCGLTPETVFGPLGRSVLECHHLRPLAEGERSTRLPDLLLVCANCHRLIHASRPWPSPHLLRRGLQALVETQSTAFAE